MSATYRAVLSTSKVVEAASRTVTLGGAKRFAVRWAANCGAAGHIHLEELQGAVWVHVSTLKVKDSEPAGWEDV